MTRPYAVGYKNPPTATRFQPGRSGNPQGRPPGVLTLAGALQAALAERVTVKEHGRSRTLSKLDVMVKQIVNKAAGGDLIAFKQVTQMLALQPLDHPEEPNQDQVPTQDQQLLAGLMERIQRTARTNLTTLLTQENNHGPAEPETDPGRAQGDSPE